MCVLHSQLLHCVFLVCHFKADLSGNWEETVNELLIRFEVLEAQNKHLSHENDVLNERLSRLHDVFSERLSRQNDEHKQNVRRLTDELNILKQNQAAAVNCQQTTLPPSPKPDTRSQFTAFACTFDLTTLSCPSGRTILATSAVYGRYDKTCDDDCCAPNPKDDCTELVEENSPSDWLAIQALCDGQTSCEFENPGTVLDDCSDQPSDYLQLFYDCLPDDETEPVAFTA